MTPREVPEGSGERAPIVLVPVMMHMKIGEPSKHILKTDPTTQQMLKIL